MADDDDKKAPDEKGSESGKTDKKQEPGEAEWTKLSEGKFKSPEELAKAYKDLEKKLGEQGEELGYARQFVEIAQPILQQVQDDPELFKAVEAKFKKNTDDSKDKKPDGKKEGNLEDVRSVTSDLILAKFEEKKGITKLSPDERKQIREKIGSVIKRTTGQYLTDVDLRRLGQVLEDAYIVANYDKLVDKAKSGTQDEDDLDDGRIGNLSAKSGKSEEYLTPDELRVASKMGLTKEQYLSGKKSTKR